MCRENLRGSVAISLHSRGCLDSSHTNNPRAIKFQSGCSHSLYCGEVQGDVTGKNKAEALSTPAFEILRLFYCDADIPVKASSVRRVKNCRAGLR